jgi:CubicO group peptidase (beta-lactamase class C family)
LPQSPVAAFALAHETPWSRDLAAVIPTVFDERPPENEVLGPVGPRGGPAGIVLHRGREIARWGDPHRADLTFSVAKSYLSILAGIAYDDGLIPDVEEPVGARVDDPVFQGPNAAVTWQHLLQQTSEWQGMLWGKSDMIDRNRVVGGGPEANAKKGTFRELRPPGGFWEYNDVRVNVLAYALLLVFRRPLPEVFSERVLQPIGASDPFEWHGYRTSWVTLDGRRVQSVSGGSHWGGGVFVSAADQARIGRLMLQRGEWEGRRLLSEAWIEKSLAPCPLNRGYGYLWWLNTGRQRAPAASERAFCAVGAGGNYTWVDPERELVAVARWLDPAVEKEFVRLAVEEAERSRRA